MNNVNNYSIVNKLLKVCGFCRPSLRKSHILRKDRIKTTPGGTVQPSAPGGYPPPHFSPFEVTKRSKWQSTRLTTDAKPTKMGVRGDCYGKRRRLRLMRSDAKSHGTSLPQTELGASWRGMEGGWTLRKTIGVAEEKAKGRKRRCERSIRLKGECKNMHWIIRGSIRLDYRFPTANPNYLSKQ